MNKAYIILVNYKGYTDTIECLESVLKSGYTNFQVFVVDNSPGDKPSTELLNWMNNGVQTVETLFPELVYPLVNKPISHTFITENDLLAKDSPFLEQTIVLVRAENRGFAAANNVALKYIKRHASANSFIWILNNDTVIEKDALEKLVNFSIAKGPKTVVGSKLMYYHQKGKLQAVAGRYNSRLGATYHVGEGEEDNGQYDQFIFGDDNYIVGASIFISKTFIDEVGVMNECYFLYYEELDWFLTAKKHAFTCALQPAVVIYHKEGASIRGEKKTNDFSDHYSIINRLKFTKKWYPGYIYTVASGVIYALVKRLLKGKFQFVKTETPQVLKVLFAKDTCI